MQCFSNVFEKTLTSMFSTMFFKTQNIVQTMLIAHPYFQGTPRTCSPRVYQLHVRTCSPGGYRTACAGNPPILLTRYPQECQKGPKARPKYEKLEAGGPTAIFSRKSLRFPVRPLPCMSVVLVGHLIETSSPLHV